MTSRRAGFSVIALILLLVFLLGMTLKRLDQATKERHQIQASLSLSQRSIVDKLVEFLVPIIEREQRDLLAGQTPNTRLESVLRQLNGIDPALVQQAVEKAMRDVAREESTTTTSTARPRSQGVSSSTTTSSTTTTRPPSTSTSTSTSSPSTTTTSTTRPCALNLGLVKLCLS